MFVAVLERQQAQAVSRRNIIMIPTCNMRNAGNWHDTTATSCFAQVHDGVRAYDCNSSAVCGYATHVADDDLPGCPVSWSELLWKDRQTRRLRLTAHILDHEWDFS